MRRYSKAKRRATAQHQNPARRTEPRMKGQGGRTDWQPPHLPHQHAMYPPPDRVQWTQHVSPTGEIFYYNHVTGACQYGSLPPMVYPPQAHPSHPSHPPPTPTPNSFPNPNQNYPVASSTKTNPKLTQARKSQPVRPWPPVPSQTSNHAPSSISRYSSAPTQAAVGASPKALVTAPAPSPISKPTQKSSSDSNIHQGHQSPAISKVVIKKEREETTGALVDTVDARHTDTDIGVQEPFREQVDNVETHHTDPQSALPSDVIMHGRDSDEARDESYNEEPSACGGDENPLNEETENENCHVGAIGKRKRDESADEKNEDNQKRINSDSCPNTDPTPHAEDYSNQTSYNSTQAEKLIATIKRGVDMGVDPETTVALLGLTPSDSILTQYLELEAPVSLGVDASTHAYQHQPWIVVMDGSSSEDMIRSAVQRIWISAFVMIVAPGYRGYRPTVTDSPIFNKPVFLDKNSCYLEIAADTTWSPECQARLSQTLAHVGTCARGMIVSRDVGVLEAWEEYLRNHGTPHLVRVSSMLELLPHRLQYTAELARLHGHNLPPPQLQNVHSQVG